MSKYHFNDGYLYYSNLNPEETEEADPSLLGVKSNNSNSNKSSLTIMTTENLTTQTEQSQKLDETLTPTV